MSSLEEVSKKKNDELIRKSTASKVFIISLYINFKFNSCCSLFEQWRLMGIAMLLFVLLYFSY